LALSRPYHLFRDPDLSIRESLFAWLFGGANPRTANALSRLGERRDVERLTYNPLVFVWYHAVGLASAGGVARSFERHYPFARRYLDVGAGTGVFAALLRRRGFDVSACEYNRLGRRIAQRQGVRAYPFDLTSEPPTQAPGSFDVAYCFEVAEHVPAPLGDRLVAFIASRAPLVVFTAAHPGQGGHGHINEQPQSYWIERFAANGMRHNAAMSSELAKTFQQERVVYWLIDNVMVFERTDE
jgi:SAM-dependent methyltransferase